MNRPGPAGLLILLAFAVVFAIEFKTVLAMFGIDVASRVYFPVAAMLIAFVLAVVLLLPDGENKRAAGA